MIFVCATYIHFIYRILWGWKSWDCSLVDTKYTDTDTAKTNALGLILYPPISKVSTRAMTVLYHNKATSVQSIMLTKDDIHASVKTSSSATHCTKRVCPVACVTLFDKMYGKLVLSIIVNFSLGRSVIKHITQIQRSQISDDNIYISIKYFVNDACITVLNCWNIIN